jgi:hypothetical protein
VPIQKDYFFPESEAAERAALIVPELVMAEGRHASAVLRNPATEQTVRKNALFLQCEL